MYGFTYRHFVHARIGIHHILGYIIGSLSWSISIYHFYFGIHFKPFSYKLWLKCFSRNYNIFQCVKLFISDGHIIQHNIKEGWHYFKNCNPINNKLFHEFLRLNYNIARIDYCHTAFHKRSKKLPYGYIKALGCILCDNAFFIYFQTVYFGIKVVNHSCMFQHSTFRSACRSGSIYYICQIVYTCCLFKVSCFCCINTFILKA
ncbi:MAG: hypothetical protein BWY74_01410 [Firmicutes bacterium ADurb.Bin419]|nr:MAG: hypothetical protein BWY74_01410 [Firmicutes bacterium ADurb.Bin419]